MIPSGVCTSGCSYSSDHVLYTAWSSSIKLNPSTVALPTFLPKTELEIMSATLYHAVLPSKLPSTYSTVHILSTLAQYLTSLNPFIRIPPMCFFQIKIVLTNACFHKNFVYLKTYFLYPPLPPSV